MFTSNSGYVLRFLITHLIDVSTATGGLHLVNNVDSVPDEGH